MKGGGFHRSAQALEHAQTAPAQVEVVQGRLSNLRGLDVDGFLVAIQPQAFGRLKGLVASVDWRIGGRISEVLEQGLVKPGDEGLLLMEGSDILGAQRIFVSGPEAKQAAVAQRLVEAGVTSLGLTLSSSSEQAAVQEAKAWLQLLRSRLNRIVLVGPDHFAFEAPR